MTAEPGREWNEMLRDRSRVVVRPIVADDVAGVAGLIRGLSPWSRHLLFLAGIAELGDAELSRLCDGACAQDAAFVAVDPADPDGRIIGLGRYVHDADGGAAELAIAVADDWQHRGLGTLLLRHLVDSARTHGIRRLYSIDAASNHRMRQLATHMGFAAHADPEDPRQVIFSLDLARSSAEGARRT